ncbi:hypothetical protein D3C80_1666330 [compost metagenome]
MVIIAFTQVTKRQFPAQFFTQIKLGSELGAVGLGRAFISGVIQFLVITGQTGCDFQKRNKGWRKLITCPDANIATSPVTVTEINGAAIECFGGRIDISLQLYRCQPSNTSEITCNSNTAGKFMHA